MSYLFSVRDTFKYFMKCSLVTADSWHELTFPCISFSFPFNFYQLIAWTLHKPFQTPTHRITLSTVTRANKQELISFILHTSRRFPGDSMVKIKVPVNWWVVLRGSSVECSIYCQYCFIISRFSHVPRHKSFEILHGSDDLSSHQCHPCPPTSPRMLSGSFWIINKFDCPFTPSNFTPLWHIWIPAIRLPHPTSAYLKKLTVCELEL